MNKSQYTRAWLNWKIYLLKEIKEMMHCLRLRKSQTEHSCLTSYGIQSQSYSEIKYFLDHQDLHVWGFTKIFIFLTIILTLHLWEENFLQENFFIEML